MALHLPAAWSPSPLLSSGYVQTAGGPVHQAGMHSAVAPPRGKKRVLGGLDFTESTAKVPRFGLERCSLDELRLHMARLPPDMALVLESGERLPVHQVLMTRCSAVFREGLAGRPAPLEVPLTNCPSRPVIAAVLQWMYTGAPPCLAADPTFSPAAFFQEYPDLADPIPDGMSQHLQELEQAYKTALAWKIDLLTYEILKVWGYVD
eukprot:TRINITY_DN36730_c0_g2_i1.p1 TRINITY_DN36730_c0_g2~~TRINITY_DN36730_c0_g2_i1.p1  ORF type:complete len:206 (-),score=22.60 TRINITY_DN36730_c0_g2_i1:335-952(-)